MFYAILDTDIGFSILMLRICYAMSGTERGYATTRRRIGSSMLWLSSGTTLPIVLRLRYALSCTSIDRCHHRSYADTMRSPVLPCAIRTVCCAVLSILRAVRYWRRPVMLRWRYALSGTELAYGAGRNFRCFRRNLRLPRHPPPASHKLPLIFPHKVFFLFSHKLHSFLLSPFQKLPCLPHTPQQTLLLAMQRLVLSWRMVLRLVFAVCSTDLAYGTKVDMRCAVLSGRVVLGGRTAEGSCPTR
eukprot:1211421-Rhodomonas_salina.2